jgi:lactate permease
MLTPIGDSLPLSCLVAVLPVLLMLVMLGVLRRPAWQASQAGLAVGFVVAVIVGIFRLASLWTALPPVRCSRCPHVQT